MTATRTPRPVRPAKGAAASRGSARGSHALHRLQFEALQTVTTYATSRSPSCGSRSRWSSSRRSCSRDAPGKYRLRPANRKSSWSERPARRLLAPARHACRRPWLGALRRRASARRDRPRAAARPARGDPRRTRRRSRPRDAPRGPRRPLGRALDGRTCLVITHDQTVVEGDPPPRARSYRDLRGCDARVTAGRRFCEAWQALALN